MKVQYWGTCWMHEWISLYCKKNTCFKINSGFISSSTSNVWRQCRYSVCCKLFSRTCFWTSLEKHTLDSAWYEQHFSHRWWIVYFSAKKFFNAQQILIIISGGNTPVFRVFQQIIWICNLVNNSQHNLSVSRRTLLCRL